MPTLKRLVLIAPLLVASCGYHAGDSRTSTETLKIFVPVLENVTVRPLDLNEITSSFRESLESIKGVIIVNRREDADLVVLGREKIRSHLGAHGLQGHSHYREREWLAQRHSERFDRAN